MVREEFIGFDFDSKFTLGYWRLFDFNGIAITKFISFIQ